MGNALDVAYVTQDTYQSTTDDSWEPPGCATGNAISGSPYLIAATAWVYQSGTAPFDWVIIRHDSSSLADSSQSPRTYSTAGRGACYKWWTIWTPPSNEPFDIQLNQWAANTQGIDIVNIAAVSLAHVTSGSEFFYAEENTDETVTTSWNSHVELTFTPDVDGHNWLILPYARIDPDSATGQDVMMRVSWSGDISSTDPLCRKESNNNAQIMGFGVPIVRNLNNASHTITIQHSQEVTGNGDASCLHSSIVAIDLDATFESYSFECNPGADIGTISTTDYATEAATCNLAPLQSGGNVLVLGGWTHDVGSSGVYMKQRLQVDDDDIIPNVTSNAYYYDRTDATTEEHDLALSAIHVSASSTGTYTYDLDVSATTGGAAKNTCIVAISLFDPAGGLIPSIYIGSEWKTLTAMSVSDGTTFKTATDAWVYDGTNFQKIL